MKAVTFFSDSAQNHNQIQYLSWRGEMSLRITGPAGRSAGLYLIPGLPQIPAVWPDTKHFSLGSFFSKLYHHHCFAICWGRRSFPPALKSMILRKPLKGKTFIKVWAQLQPSDSFMWWEVVRYRKTGRCLSKQVHPPPSFYYFYDNWLLGFCWQEPPVNKRDALATAQLERLWN